MKPIAMAALGLVLTLILSGPLSAKSKTVRMTITGSDLGRPVEVADPSVLAKLDIWVGPGTTINGVPDTRNGFVMWS